MLSGVFFAVSQLAGSGDDLMEMNNHESRRVREAAAVSNDLLETRGLAVMPQLARVGGGGAGGVAGSLHARCENCDLSGGGGAGLSQVTGTWRAAAAVVAASRKLLNDSEVPLGRDTS